MAVKVRRERPDQRRHHRVTAPLYVDVGGQRLRAADWSLGGLRLEGYPGTLPEAGAELALALTLPFQGFDVSFNAKAAVVRTAPATAMVAVRFTDIGERERELMQHFIEELVRGSMVDIEDTIQRIDVPVTPASLQPDPSPVSKLPVRRWPVKTAVMSAVYLVLGLVVFSYAALLGYSNFYRMEVQTAVISAPVETVTAQSDGRIVWTGIKPGDPVRTGDVIVNVHDNQLERELELADIAVREQKAKLLFLKRRQQDELEKMKGFSSVDTLRLQQMKLELESLDAQLHLAKNQLGRIATLHAKGYATDVRLEESQKQVVKVSEEIARKQIEMRSSVELASQNFGKRFFNGDNMVGDVAGIEAQVKLAEHEIQLAGQRQQALVHHRERLAVQAPFDGTLLELPRVNQAHVRRGDVIAIIEQRRQRQVTAFLNQDEVLKVGQGDEAMIYIPSLGETQKARVARIDRTSAFVREQDQRQAPGYSWRGAVDRSAKVTLEFADAARVADHDIYRSGLPVVVVFPQRSTNSLLASIRQKMSVAF